MQVLRPVPAVLCEVMKAALPPLSLSLTLSLAHSEQIT